MPVTIPVPKKNGRRTVRCPPVLVILRRSFPWQCPGDHFVPDRRFHKVVPHGRDHHELAAIDLIGDRIGLATRWQHCRPDCFPGFNVDGAKQIIRRGCNENKSPRRDNRTAIVRRAYVKR